jgi:hypothetical protein
MRYDSNPHDFRLKTGRWRLTAVLFFLLNVTLITGCSFTPFDYSDDSSEMMTDFDPQTPNTPSPADGAIDQNTHLYLSWRCTDVDGDYLTYDIYFGTNPNPPFYRSSSNYMGVSDMDCATTYYWKVTATDEHGNTSTSPVWHFRTRGGLDELGNSVSIVATEMIVEGDYAFLSNSGSGNGLTIVDIADPTAPQIASTLFSGTPVYGLCLRGQYAFLAGGGSDLRVVDIGNPSGPMVIGSLSLTGTPRGVAVMGSYAYLTSTSGAYIINISDPANPLQAGLYTSDRALRLIKAFGSHLIVSYGDDISILRINASDSTSLQMGGAHAISGIPQQFLAAGDLVCVVGDDYYAHFFDFSSGDGQLEYSLYFPGAYPGFAVDGNEVYVANYYGIQAFDISDIENRRQTVYSEDGFTADRISVRGEYLYAIGKEYGTSFDVLRVYRRVR